MLLYFVMACYLLFQLLKRLRYFFKVLQVVSSCFGILLVPSVVYDVEAYFRSFWVVFSRDLFLGVSMLLTVTEGLLSFVVGFSMLF